MNRFNGWRSLASKDDILLKEFEDLSMGCFVFVLDLDNGNVEALTMHKFE
jgi:hypothetical protein